jgi:hypothetical protein
VLFRSAIKRNQSNKELEPAISTPSSSAYIPYARTPNIPEPSASGPYRPPAQPYTAPKPSYSGQKPYIPGPVGTSTTPEASAPKPYRYQTIYPIQKQPGFILPTFPKQPVFSSSDPKTPYFMHPDFTAPGLPKNFVIAKDSYTGQTWIVEDMSSKRIRVRKPTVSRATANIFSFWSKNDK